MSFFLATTICFVACHSGPADHFATFAEQLAEKGYCVRVYASEVAIDQFEKGKAIPFSRGDLQSVLEGCQTASAVITDVGDPFDLQLQEELVRTAPHVKRLAYYDNPEPYVPGGYSDLAAKVMQAAQTTLFANANLGEVGIGYYPMAQAERLIERRKGERTKLRAQFFAEQELEDKGQKIAVYFGGNHEEYFEKALPAFLRCLEEADLSQAIVVFQQHPGAKAANRDGKLLPDKLLISHWKTEDLLALADSALYYQTSMAPLFALADIAPAQIGHKPYLDLLIRNNLCPFVSNGEALRKALLKNARAEKKAVYDGLGIRENWLERLEQAL